MSRDDATGPVPPEDGAAVPSEDGSPGAEPRSSWVPGLLLGALDGLLRVELPVLDDHPGIVGPDLGVYPVVNIPQDAHEALVVGLLVFALDLLTGS